MCMEANFQAFINCLKRKADTTNEQVQSEIKNTLPFTVPPPQMKYLGINQTRHVQNLDEENHRTLVKETEELIKRLQVSHIPGQESMLSRCLSFATWSAEPIQSFSD